MDLAATVLVFDLDTIVARRVEVNALSHFLDISVERVGHAIEEILDAVADVAIHKR